MQFGTRSYQVRLQFYESPGCHEAVTSREPWPPPTRDCSKRVAIVGGIVGIGVAATGESIIGVAVEVSADCFQTLVLGEAPNQ